MIILLFLSALVAAAALLWWHAQETRHLSLFLKQFNVSEPVIARVRSHLFGRTAQMLVLLLLLIAALYKTRTPAPAAPTPQETASTAIPAPPAATVSAPVAEQPAAPVVFERGAPVENTTAAPPLPAETPASNAPIEQLFEPAAEEDQPDSAPLNRIKQRYEELLVNYFFLNRCGLVPVESFHIINSALMLEIASANGPGRLQYDILSAARASYQEIYARTPCDRPETKTLLESFKNYLDSLAVNYVPSATAAPASR